MSYLSLNSTYSRAIPHEAYIGFDHSSLMCGYTLEKYDFFTKPLDLPDYVCPAFEVSPKVQDVW